MTDFGRWLVFGVVVIGALAVVLLFSTVLLWIGAALLVIALFAGGWQLRSGVLRGRLEVRQIEAQTAKAEAEAAQAAAQADLQRAQAAAAWQQTRLIPASAIGAILAQPAERDLYHVWTFRQQ